MPGGVHAQINLGDPALRVDEVGVALGDLHDSEVSQCAVAVGHLAVLVGKQGEGQVIFFGESGMRIGIVDADANHPGIEFFDLEQVVAESAGFLGTARRIVLRVEIEHQPFACVILEGVRLLLGVRQHEFRRGTADFWNAAGMAQFVEHQESNDDGNADDGDFHGIPSI